MLTHQTDQLESRQEVADLLVDVEQFLGQQFSTQTMKLFLIGDNAAHLNKLTSELNLCPTLDVIGRARTTPELLLSHLSDLSPDIIIFDVGLCIAHHTRTIQLIRSMCPATQIIALLPDDVPLHVQQARWCGVHGYVLRNAPIQKLVDTIGAVSTCQRYLDQEGSR